MGTAAKIFTILVSGLVCLAFQQQSATGKTRYILPATGAEAISPEFEAHWVSRQETQEAHSANITLLGDTPVSVWYGGTEEGHADVALFLSSFTGNWSPAQAITDRATSEKGLGRFIRKVGNPALHVWPDGALGVFYVSVSVGGWGASAINYMESTDGGQSWGQPQRIVTSPFLNISTLVRTQPLVREDGSIELPVYHEFIGKFSESLHLRRGHHRGNSTGGSIEVIEKVRISWGKHSLQPAIAAVSPTRSEALLRHAVDSDGRVLAATSLDTGMSWNTPRQLQLPNPNSAVAVINLGDGNLLMALNDTEDGRHRLSLAMKPITQGDWGIVKVLEEEPAEGEEEFEFSYPSLARDVDGMIHAVYTWNQKRIRHVQFNQAWLTGE